MRAAANFVAWLVRLLRLFAAWIDRRTVVQRPIPDAAETVEQFSFTSPEPEPEPEPEPPPEPDPVEVPEVLPHDALEAAFFFAADISHSEEEAEIPMVVSMVEPEPVPESAPRRRRPSQAARLQVVQTLRSIPAPTPFPVGPLGTVGGTFTPQVAGLPTFSPGAQTASAQVFERSGVLRTTGAIPFP